MYSAINKKIIDIRSNVVYHIRNTLNIHQQDVLVMLLSNIEDTDVKIAKKTVHSEGLSKPNFQFFSSIAIAAATVW